MTCHMIHIIANSLTWHDYHTGFHASLDLVSSIHAPISILSTRFNSYFSAEHLKASADFFQLIMREVRHSTETLRYPLAISTNKCE